MKIAILTLTGQRDKFIDKMLAEELTKLGHDARVRNFIMAGPETVTYEKPDVVIVPMVGGQYKLDFVKQCKQWGIEVIVRRGEAGMGREQFERLSDDRKAIILGNWNYNPYVDLECVWGREFADILAEQGHVSAEKLRVCGAFAFDPYFKNSSINKAARKKTILFATGFSTADCRSEYCETGLPEDSGYHQEIYKLHRAARDVWLSAINELVKWFGDEWAFELKVRPGEQTEEYVQQLPPFEVKIHPRQSASSEILRSVDILVHSGSTLAIEAYLLGIPSFNFCNVNPDPLLAKVSPNLKTYRELEFHLATATKPNINENVYRELQDHLYGKIDGKACERAAGYIHDHITARKIRTNIPNSWPKIARYHDKSVVRLKPQKGDHRWVCPCCRNIYWAKFDGKSSIARCPYCSMQIEMTAAGGQAVAK